MRPIALLLAATLLSGCQSVRPPPAEFRARANSDLTTRVDGVLTACAWHPGAQICLIPRDSPQGEAVGESAVVVPRGTPYVVRKHVTWPTESGRAEDLIVNLPSVLPEQPVALSRGRWKALLDFEPR